MSYSTNEKKIEKKCIFLCKKFADKEKVSTFAPATKELFQRCKRVTKRSFKKNTKKNLVVQKIYHIFVTRFAPKIEQTELKQN